MQRITLENYLIVPCINLLNGMELKASDSRHRTKFLGLLKEAFEGLQESEKALLMECAELDESGDLKQSENGTYTLKKDKAQEYHAEHKKLMDEKVIIEGGMHAHNVEAFGKILQDYDGVISGAEAAAFDRLLEEFEKE